MKCPKISLKSLTHYLWKVGHMNTWILVYIKLGDDYESPMLYKCIAYWLVVVVLFYWMCLLSHTVMAHR